MSQILFPKKYLSKLSLFIKVLSVKLKFLYTVETRITYFMTLQKKFHVHYHFLSLQQASVEK